MGLFDTFKGKQYKSEADELRAEVERLRSLMTPEMQNASNLQAYVEQLKSDSTALGQNIARQNDTINSLNYKINNLNGQINAMNAQIFKLDEEIGMQEFGLYRPHYDFATSEQYSNRLEQIRNGQKNMIKLGNAVTGNMNWTVNGSIPQGNKMVRDMQKLLLRAFNSECDEVIDKVRYNNYDKAFARISKSCEAISKLGSMMGVAITQPYYNSKIAELQLALEYRIKKQQEKEEQKEIRARLREEAKLQKEIEEARKKIAKEQSHYQNALAAVSEQLNRADGADKEALLLKKQEIEHQLAEIDRSIKDIDYREANAKAGYVYIISNVGSFGENVYKIGMTRRLEPMDRIDELGDASVPFNFDVHALIFSDNAPALEAALHRAFENRKVNMVNPRREFFNVTLEEIEKVVKQNYDKTVDFIRFAPAEQYRESLKIKNTQ